MIDATSIAVSREHCRAKACPGEGRGYRARAADARAATRKTMIVALARKLLVAPCSPPGARLWKLVTIGEVPHGVVLRPATQAAV